MQFNSSTLLFNCSQSQTQTQSLYLSDSKPLSPASFTPHPPWRPWVAPPPPPHFLLCIVRPPPPHSAVRLCHRLLKFTSFPNRPSVAFEFLQDPLLSISIQDARLFRTIRLRKMGSVSKLPPLPLSNCSSLPQLTIEGTHEGASAG